MPASQNVQMASAQRGTHSDLHRLSVRHWVRKALKGRFTTPCAECSSANLIEDVLIEKEYRRYRIALIVGHERGKTESFRTYSKGTGMKELSEYVELVNYEALGI